jgi:hypothetical protein
MLKYAKIAFLALLFPLSMSAQHLEGGFFLGTSTYYGDLDDETIHTKETHLGYGLVARYNINDFVSIRGSILGGELSADDANNDKRPEIAARNLSFRTSIAEFSIIPEFNILGYNPYDRIISPYVFAGLSVFRFNPEAQLDNVWHQLQPLGTEGQGLPGNPSRYSLTEFAIPMGLGVKFAATEYWNISWEVALRYTFTDYIDDVSGTYEDRDVLIAAYGNETTANLANREAELLGANAEPVNRAGSARGNPSSNDLYVFTGFTFSYNFFDGFGGKKYGCPTNF